VALPSVGRGLGVTVASTATVLSAYFVAYAVVLLPAGALVDRYGARQLALSGLAVFALGAGAGALSNTFGLLVLTRVVQGVGAGLVSPAALAAAVSGFPPERRGSALGIWGASAGVANLVGPLLGGILTVAFGWRAAWWVLVPMALAAAWGIERQVPSSLHEDKPVGRQPFVNQTVLVATLVAALTFAVMIGSFFLAEQYLQRAGGFSALGASAALILVAVMVGIGAPLAGRLVDRHGERFPAVLGFSGTALGLVALGIPGVPLHSVVTILPLIPVGLGLGMLFVPTSRAALNATPPAIHGRTSAVLSVGRLLGAAVGGALGGLALSGGATASTVHDALLVAAGICLFIGVPASLRLGSGTPVVPSVTASREAA
jgi:predicted MFS family arabinose efflux permease